LRAEDGQDEVVVFPITSTPPSDEAAAVEMPVAMRERFGLQDGPCWAVVKEVNIFIWPRPDPRSPENPAYRYVYGSLPHALMLRVRKSFAAWRLHKGIRSIRRSE
jgi:hypothetical protein